MSVSARSITNMLPHERGVVEPGFIRVLAFLAAVTVGFIAAHNGSWMLGLFSGMFLIAAALSTPSKRPSER